MDGGRDGLGRDWSLQPPMHPPREDGFLFQFILVNPLREDGINPPREDGLLLKSLGSLSPT